MSVLSDKWIRKMSKENGMISPFEEKQVRGSSISYGLSSFDMMQEYLMNLKFYKCSSEIVDPKILPTNLLLKKQVYHSTNSFVARR